MRPDHLQNVSKDAFLKPLENCSTVNPSGLGIESVEEVVTVSGLDNIITISAASINECRPDEQIAEDLEQIKQTAVKENQKLVQFRSKQQQQQESTEPTVTTKSQRHCGPSKYVSFQDNIAEVHHRKGRRLNGLQLPLHPLQIFGWLVLILFGLASFWLLIPSFSVELQGPLYGLISGLYIVHIISHVTALLLDPADRELRRIHRNDRIVPEFDRSKHTHVIENGRCHLCNIRTSSARTKHCSVCNKCVGKFDHHCKWLNHCIGSRNYVAFLMCVVSAVIATLVIVAAVIAQIVLYYVQPQWLSFWYLRGVSPVSTSRLQDSDITLGLLSNDTYGNSSSNGSMPWDMASNNSNESYFIQPGDTEELINSTLATLYENITSITTLSDDSANSSTLTPLEVIVPELPNNASSVSTPQGLSLNDTIFLVLIAALGLLAAITAGLLLHLCFFHIYISFLGLTTYEYIRNHRQAQEAAKSKKLLSTLPNNGTGSPYHKKTPDCGQIYFCSSLRHPNGLDPRDRHYFEATQKPQHNLHCCTNSREYHQTALKTYYMCSLLEEGQHPSSSTLGVSHISGASSDVCESNELDQENYKNFHCCSTFAATTTQRRVSAATTKATLVSDLESSAASLSARRSYLQFTEQCTFCTFRIRSPMVSKRASATSTRSAMSSTHQRKPPSPANSQEPATTAASNSIEHQRCCMKAISKHQRWRRKWNCCSSVPDSPDVPNDIIAALAIRHQHSLAPANKINGSEIPVQFIKGINGSSSRPTSSHSTRPTSPRSANLKAQTRTRNARTWPLARLRHMMRMLHRSRRPRCNHAPNSPAATHNNSEHIKQNQIRPLQLHSNGQHQSYNHYYDSSSPQPASSTSDDNSIYSDASTPCQNRTIETILPTSAIRNDDEYDHMTPMGLILPPALPPPTRRKIPHTSDLEELAQSLGFSASSTIILSSPAQRLPSMNNVYRRQRRKHFLRTRSPTLSPIHESGLSNPTSPQLSACRHNSAGSSCSPAMVNKICGAGNGTEMNRKNASNSSLHSISSNSSST